MTSSGISQGSGNSANVTNPLVAHDVFVALRRGYERSRYNNPHYNAVMVSPPTVTLSATAPISTPIYYNYTTSPGSFYGTGGGPAQASGSGATWQWPAASVVSGGNTDATHNANGWRVKMLVDAIAPSFRVLNSTSAMRFVVNGQYVSTAGTIPTNGGTGNWITLDFTAVGGRAVREIWVESIGGAQAFLGAYVSGSETVNPVPTGLRMTFLGDSLVAGTIGGTGPQTDGFVYVMGECFGVADIRASGIGGQGVINVGGGWNLPSRLTPSVNTTALTVDAPPSDIFVFAMGTNDTGQTYATNVPAYISCITQLIALYPTTPIIVLGCPGNNAGPSQANTDVDQAIAAAVLAIGSPLLIYVPSSTATPTPIQTGVGSTLNPTTGTMTATAVITAATTCTLTAGFPGKTGVYSIVFDSGVTKTATLTNASTAVNWNGALSAGVTILYYGQIVNMTLTAPPAAGATSATLSVGFTGSTATYLTTFSDGSVRAAAMTNNSTAVTWTTPLLNAVTTNVWFKSQATAPGNGDLNYNGSDVTHPLASGHKIVGQAYADAVYSLIKNL